MKWFAIVLVLVGFKSLGADTVALGFKDQQEPFTYLSNVVAIADCDQPNCERIDYVVDGRTNTFHNWGRLFTVRKLARASTLTITNNGRYFLITNVWSTNAAMAEIGYISTNVVSGSVSSNYIRTLEQDGTLCRILGHAWQPHTIWDGFYIAYQRKCYHCQAVSEAPEAWKRILP